MTIEMLKSRAKEGLRLTDLTMRVLPGLGITASERSLTFLPLLMASMDNAATLLFLLAEKPERSWVAALSLHRSQFDYFLRAAFFARAASEQELGRFRSKGKMPKRAEKSGRKRDIFIRELAEEVSDSFQWDEKLVNTLKGHWSPLSGIVHGGTEVLGIYTAKGQIGIADVDAKPLLQVLDNVLVLVQLAMAVAMSASPRSEAEVSDAVEPVYKEAVRFFEGKAT